jgi:membrane-associated phospholipid phosphatase
MGDSAFVFGLATVSLLLCGLVSLTGLRLGLPLADAPLARIDRAIGFDTAAVVAYSAAKPLLSEGLYWAYSLSGPLCIAAVLWNLIRKDRVRMWQVVATILLAMQITALVSVLFPARGAILFMGLEALQGHGLPFGAGSYSAREFAHFYSGSDLLVTLRDMNGIVVFPSFHTVMALVILQGFAASRLKWLAVMVSALTIVSTVPMGGHYVVDLAGGLLVWIAACLLATWACRPMSEAA